MPRLNPARVLRSPMLRGQKIDVIRVVQTMVDGRAVNTEQPVVTVAAVVTQGSGDQLMRLAEGSRVQGTITVVTQFHLQDGQDGLAADVIRYPAGPTGRRYIVSLTSDYRDWGEGFVQAICTSEPLTPPSDA